MISREEFRVIEGKIGEALSDLELEVLSQYLDGKSYQEIAVDLERHVKSIDNALQRVKRKLERYLEKREDDDLSSVYNGLNNINKQLHGFCEGMQKK